jgi:hypothetical protein
VEAGLEGSIRTTRILVLAMVGGVMLFLLVALVLIQTGSGVAGGGSIPVAALPAVGFAVLVMLLTAPVVQRTLSTVPAGAPAGEAVGRWRTGVIVGSAVREGAGLLGIVAGLLAGSALWVLVLGGASILSLLLALPRGEELEADLRRREYGPR